MTEINGEAPVVGSSEIEIAVPPKLAWDVLTDFQSWPSWNPAVTEVSMNGGPTEGSTFRWKAGPGTITSTIQEVDAPRRIVWSGTSFGIKAIHVHTLEGKNGGTLVRTEESYDGLVARVLHGRLQKTLNATLEGGLASLKAEAERRGTTAGLTESHGSSALRSRPAAWRPQRLDDLARRRLLNLSAPPGPLGREGRGALSSLREARMPHEIGSTKPKTPP